MDNIGEFLRRKRKEKGLAQIELAQKSKVSTMSIRRYESNERSPKADELAKLGAVLGFDVEFKEGVSIIVDEKMDDSFGADVESFSSVSSSDCDSSEKYEVYKLDSLLADLVSQLNSDGYEKMIDAVQVLLKVPEFRKDFVKNV